MNSSKIDGSELCNDDLNSSIILLEDENDDDLFFMDTSQCEESDSAFLTSEKASFSELSGVVSHVFVPETDDKGKRRKNLCFNCMGEHTVADCTQPKDNRRISRNRDSFRGGRNNNTARLHENVSNSNFKPGVISGSLREALGIGSKELPEWIFRMRKRGFLNGYPPAYLKRALEKNILSFKTGEMDDQDGDEVLDEKKLFAYPGFNVFERGIRDPERFKIPSWREFVRMHQDALILKQSIKRKHTDKSTLEPTLKKKKVQLERKKSLDVSIEEGEIVDDDSILECTDMVEEEDEIEVTNDTTSSSLQQQQSTSFGQKDGDITKGTTILTSNSITAELFNHEVQKPDLGNFSKDIVPFEHRNVTTETGFFSKMLNVVKKLKKKKL